MSTETPLDLKKTINLPKTGFAQKANLTSQDLATVADKLTFTPAAGGTGGRGTTGTTTKTTLKGLINVNTAPREVLGESPPSPQDFRGR